MNMIRNVYIHLPFCIKKCHFCAFPIHALGQQNKNSIHTYQLMKQYVQKIQKQITLSINKCNHHILQQSQIETLYIGGGTPSLFHPSHINSLIQTVKNCTSKAVKIQEITLELNPEEIQKIPQFQQAGVNRFSIGIQSFNTRQLKKFNRFNINTLKQSNRDNTKQTINMFQFNKQLKNSKQFYQNIKKKIQILIDKKYLQNFNIDFILDMNPLKQDQQIILEFIENIKPSHITLYILQIIQNTYLQRKIRQSLVNNKKDIEGQQNPQTEYNQLIKGFHKINQKYINFSNILTRKYGYSHYEVSNFAKTVKNDYHRYESKHNKAYWQGDREFVGFGMGASSLLKENNINSYYRKYLTKFNQFNKTQDEAKVGLEKIQREQMYRITNPSTISKYFSYVKLLQTEVQKKDLYRLSQKLQLDLSNPIHLINIDQKLSQIKSLGLIHKEEYPFGIIQSYILSAIRTQNGISFQKIMLILTSQISSKSLQTSNCIIKALDSTIQKFYQQLSSIDELKHCFIFFQETTNHFQIKYQDQKIAKVLLRSRISGFKLLPPSGYLIADQLGHKLVVLLENNIQKMLNNPFNSLQPAGIC